jgi:mono/diheme cytochrome c family protein
MLLFSTPEAEHACVEINQRTHGLAALPAPLFADAVAEGHNLALQACSACHQTGPGDVVPPLVRHAEERRGVRAPRFTEIARDPRKEAIYLRAVIRSPHYPMKEQAIDPGDLDAIVSSIESLRPPPAGRKKG